MATAGITARPTRGPQERDTSDPIVRAAIENVRVNLAALPASEIIQLVLFPDTITSVTDRVGERNCMVSNLFRGHRRYNRLRQVLAEYLQVPLPILSHLIDATPSRPVAQQLPDQADVLEVAGLAPELQRPPIDFRDPPYPLYRDGTNPLEVIALRRIEREAPAMPGTRIISYALFPEGLWHWAKREQWNADGVLSALSNNVRNSKIERAVARRLGTDMKVLDRFIQSERKEPVVTLPAGGALASGFGTILDTTLPL